MGPRGSAEPPHDDAVPALIPTARPIVISESPFLSPVDDPLLLRTSTRGQALGDLAVLLLALVTLELAVGSVVRSFTGVASGTALPPPEQLRDWLVPIVSVRALVVVGVIVIILRARRQSARTIGLGAPERGLDILIGIGAMLAAYALIYLWVGLSLFLWPDWLQGMGKNAERLADLLPALNPLAYVELALVVGVYEEVLFRGFIMPRLRRVMGSWMAAVVVSTLLFVVLHVGDQERAALIPVAILSLLFSATTIWRRSLVPGIVGHFLFDLSQFIGIQFLRGGTP